MMPVAFRPVFSLPALAGTALLLVAFICGLFFHGYRDVIYAPGIIALLAFALLAVLPGCWKTLTLPASPFAWAVFGFWLYITLSLCWTTIPFVSLVTYLIALVLPVTFFSLLLAQNRMTWLIYASIAIGGALLLLAGWATIQGLFLAQTYYRAYHPLQNANNLGELLNLGLFAALPFFLLRTRFDKYAALALAACALFFAGILATESRTALFAALFSLPLLLLLMRGEKRSILILLGALIVTFLLMQWVRDFSLINRITHIATAGSGENTFESRKALWAAALQIARDYPLTGTGLGTFFMYYPARRQPLLDDSAGNWVHNDPLQFAVEMGWAAPVLFYLILVLAGLRTYRALRHAPQGSILRAAIVAPFCGLLTFGIAAHTDFPFYMMPLTLCAGILLAVWHDATTRALSPSHPQAADRTIRLYGWQQSFITIMTIVAALMVAMMAASSAAGTHYMNQAQIAIGRLDFNNFITHINKADKWGPSSFIDPELQLASLYTDTLIPPAGILMPHEQAQIRDQVLALLAHAESLNPAWAEINYKRGRLYAVTGAYDLTPDGQEKAREEYQIAIRKNPMHLRAREELAKIHAAQGDPATAFDILAAGLEYPISTNVQDSYLPLMRQLQYQAQIQKKYRGQTP